MKELWQNPRNFSSSAVESQLDAMTILSGNFHWLTVEPATAQANLHWLYRW